MYDDHTGNIYFCEKSWINRLFLHKMLNNDSIGRLHFVTMCGKYNASPMARQTIVALATAVSEATPV